MANEKCSVKKIPPTVLCSCWIRDPECKNSGSGIRNKHPGPATMLAVESFILIKGSTWQKNIFSWLKNLSLEEKISSEKKVCFSDRKVAPPGASAQL